MSQLRVLGQGSDYGVFIGEDTQLYRSAANVLRTPDTLVVDGDIYTVAHTTYDTTVGTVASTTTKQFSYKKIGKTVLVWWHIVGTKDGTGSEITLSLPYANGSIMRSSSVCRNKDAGTWYTGYSYIAVGGSVITIYRSVDGSSFTASAAISSEGQMMYVTA